MNDKMETSVPNYYCIGDANGRILLAHAASAHAIVAVENALGHSVPFAAPVPNCVYTFPEVATAGITLEEARTAGVPASAGMFPLKFLGKAQAAGDVEGFVKVVRNRENDQLLGVHMIGHNVTECIAAAGALLHQRVTVEDVADTVFAHPTISEAIKEAAEDALYAGIHLPPRKVMSRRRRRRVTAMSKTVEQALEYLKTLGTPQELTDPRKTVTHRSRPKVNSHIHLPPNFSAFESVAQAIDLAAQQQIGVLGVSNYYDYDVYGDFVSGSRKHGIFPLFGLEIIALIDELVKAGVKINDPGNPGKIYVCGKGITRFASTPKRSGSSA